MAKRKKPRSKKAARANGGDVEGLPPLPPDMRMLIVSDQEGAADFNPADNAIEIDNGDGTISIQLGEPEEPKKPTDFDDNLAEYIDEFALGRISEQLLDAIGQDQRSYSEWVQQRADGLDLLGMKIEKPGVGNVGTSSTAVAGQSTVRDALLAEACDRFQANAFAELCPAEGPCKVQIYGPETQEKDRLAEDLEKDMNFYLTGSGGRDTATEYYPDTRKMLWWTGYASGMFKKVYRCPLRNRPVSESVDGTDLIVASNVTDLHNAGRITHQINMRPAIMKRMQILGVYRNVDLTTPTPIPNPLVLKEGDVVGSSTTHERPEDQDYTIYECYCELDIPGFEHKQSGKVTGLPLPYRVTLDKDSRVILEIRRNWEPDDSEDEDDAEDEEKGDKLPVAKIPFVLFPYATGLGFYGTGLLHRLGNYTIALTAMLRECIDAGMFASFPGFLYAKPAGRQLQNEFRVPPGGGAPIDVSAVGNDISKAVMPLPYKDVSAALVGLMEQTRQNASRYGGTADAPTGEGVVNAPVGSVLAAIDQATRIEGGVHKALYAAQREELSLLVDLFREDPEALWRGNKRPAMGNDRAARVARFKQALDQYDLVPASDPNVPSHMHRLAKANTYLQTAIQTAPFQVLDLKKVIVRWAGMVRIDGVENDLLPAMPPAGPDPKLLKLGIDKQNADTKQMQLMLKAHTDQQNRESKENIEAVKMAQNAHAAMADGGVVEPPDPHQARALDIKQQQVDLQGIKMVMDHHNEQANRDSKESIEALRIAQTLAVHPTSDQVVDQQLIDMAPLITQAQNSADGGAVYAPKPQPMAPDEARIAWVAAQLAKALHGTDQSGYSQ